MSTNFDDFAREAEASLSPTGQALSRAYAAYYGEQAEQLQNKGPVFITIRVDDPKQAGAFLRDAEDHPGAALLTPVQENGVGFEIVEVRRTPA